MARVLFIPGLSVDAFKDQKRVPNDGIYMGFDVEGTQMDARYDYVMDAYLIGFMFGGIVFGSIHVAGWNLMFPTPIEQKLWRISSLLITTLLPTIFLPILLAPHSQTVETFIQNRDLLLQISNLVVGVLYIVARLFLLVEIFRTLLYLPRDAYVSTWASNVPHVA
jgi:hypothetical protein